MVSLVDIAPLARAVPVQGDTVSVRGVSALGVASLIMRFPELRALIAGKDTNVTVDRIMEVAPQAVASIIAAGCGAEGDPRAEEVASQLPVGEQLALLTAVLELTLPNGIGPFVKQVEGLLKAVGLSESGTKARAGK